MSINVKIVTPSQIAFEGNAEQIQVPGWEGEYGVLPSHANMLTLSRPGVVTLYQKGGNKRILVGKGFVEVTATEASLLVDLCEEVESIDKKSAQDELSEALEELNRLDVTDTKYVFAKNRADLAQARADA
jgi:F-type H+-transporting ATPase subunit epsilon